MRKLGKQGAQRLAIAGGGKVAVLPASEIYPLQFLGVEARIVGLLVIIAKVVKNIPRRGSLAPASVQRLEIQSLPITSRPSPSVCRPTNKLGIRFVVGLWLKLIGKQGRDRGQIKCIILRTATRVRNESPTLSVTDFPRSAAGTRTVAGRRFIIAENLPH